MIAAVCTAAWQAVWSVLVVFIVQPCVWAACTAMCNSTLSPSCLVKALSGVVSSIFKPKAAITTKSKACSNTAAAAEPCTSSTWSISTEVASTPSSSSVNPFFEPQAQCEVAAAGIELNGLALLTGCAAVDGLQVSFPLADSYRVTVNPLFKQFIDKPAAVMAVTTPQTANILNQGNEVVLMAKQPSFGTSVTIIATSITNKSNTGRSRRSSSSSCSSGCSRRSSTSSSSSISSSSSMRSTAKSSIRSCSSGSATRRPSSSSVGNCSVTNSKRPAAVTTAPPPSLLKARPAVAQRSTSKTRVQQTAQATMSNTAAAKPNKAISSPTISPNSSMCRQPVSKATRKSLAVTKVTPPPAGEAASAATVTPHQPPAAAQAYVVAFGRRIAVPAGTRTKPCTTGPHTGSTVTGSISCSTAASSTASPSIKGSASNSRQGGRADGTSGPSPSNSSSSGLSRASTCGAPSIGKNRRSTEVAAAPPAGATRMASAATKGTTQQGRWRF